MVASVGMLMDEMISAVRAGRVVYLTGPGDNDVVAAIAPVVVVKAGLAALGRTEDGDRT